LRLLFSLFSNWDHAEVNVGWGALENGISGGAEEKKLLEALFLVAENQVPRT